jgi:DNA (cytosine-5)-methyltransferase 1
MAGKRGALTIEFLALAGRLRPRWLVWENVPGVLSADEGKAFGVFLYAMAELGYGFAYRVLDAQYFGVPQRRRRVFVVGYLGDWRRAAAVLFERESLSGNPAPSRKARQVASTLFGSGAGTERPSGTASETGFLVAGFQSSQSGVREVDTHATLDANNGSRRHNGVFGVGGIDGPLTVHENQRAEITMNDTAGALNSGGGKPGQGYPAVLAPTLIPSVRRLTPTECERLQGFPDGHTQVPIRGKPAADGPRYRAIGNSMAVPVMAWIGARIQMVEEITI